MSSNNELLIKIAGTAKDFLDEVDKVQEKTKDLEKVLKNTAKISGAAFVAFAASIAYVTKEFADYEKALVGVGKTTNIEGKKLDAFGKKFQELSSKIPVSTNELLGIAQAAGQLGVSGEANLLKFTETVAKLGVATDLSGEEAATALTRILTVTGEGVESIDKFGSVVVALGNNFAATESEIVHMATEVSRATSIFGVSAAEAAGLSAALKSVGVRSELGGSAVGRAFRAIDSSIRSGGAALANLEQITGMTGDQLKQTFEVDSVAVFQKFIEGIGRIEKGGGDTTAALAAFKLKGEEILKVLPVLAQRSELVGSALEMANKEMENATALNEEAARAFDTLGSDTQIAINNFTTLATNIGKQLAPEISTLIRGVSDIVKGISDADGVTVSVIATFLKWGAAITASIFALSTAAIGYLTFTRLLGGLRVALNASRLSMIGLTSAATLGLSVILGFLPEIIAGLGSLFNAVEKKVDTSNIDEINNKLQELKDKRDLIANSEAIDVTSKTNSLDKLDAEIRKYRELQEEKFKASQDYGTGEMLVRPKTDERGFDPLAGIQTQTIPMAVGAVDEDPSIKAAEESEDKKLNIQAKGVEKRLQKIQEENDKLKELQKAKNDEATAEEIAFADRRIEIEQQYNTAQKEENTALREATLENNRLKNEQLLEDEANYYMLKQEQEAEQVAQKAELDALLREMDVAQLDSFRAEDLEKMQKTLETEKTLKKKSQEEELRRRIAERNKYLEDETKYGTQIATMKQFFNSIEVEGVKDTTTQLMQLQNSKNAKMKSVGKAAAHANAAMATAEGAIKAYTSLAGIPIVGPALGVAAAGLLVAYGVEQQSQIASAATGGFVPNAGGGMRDRVPTMLEPGELVVPKAIAPNFIQSAGMPDTQGGNTGSSESGGGVFEFILNDRASEFVTLEQREGRAIGTIR